MNLNKPKYSKQPTESTDVKMLCVLTIVSIQVMDVVCGCMPQEIHLPS